MTNIAILFSLALKGQRSTFRGILDYAARHGPWFCQFQEKRSGEQLIDLAHMGVSGVIVSGVSREDAPAALASLKESGEDAYVIGGIVRGAQKIEIV